MCCLFKARVICMVPCILVTSYNLATSQLHVRKTGLHPNLPLSRFPAAFPGRASAPLGISEHLGFEDLRSSSAQCPLKVQLISYPATRTATFTTEHFHPLMQTALKRVLSLSFMSILPREHLPSVLKRKMSI